MLFAVFISSIMPTDKKPRKYYEMAIGFVRTLRVSTDHSKLRRELLDAGKEVS